MARFFSVFARQGKSTFAHLDALRQPLFRPTHDSFPYMSGPLDRMELVLTNAARVLLPMNGSLRGCQ